MVESKAKKLKPVSTVCIHRQHMDQPTSTGPKSGTEQRTGGHLKMIALCEIVLLVPLKQTVGSEVSTAPVITVMNRPED
jgi:hypothetical protein